MSKIVILGDYMVDKYSDYSTSRLSPEAPVPILKDEKSILCLGGASNLASNISAFKDLDINCFGNVGNDYYGRWLSDKLTNSNVKASFNFLDNATTILKHRISANGHQICRIDTEQKSYPKTDLPKNFCLEGMDALILSDYGKETFPDVRDILLSCKRRNIPTFVDPKGRNIEKYSNAFLLKPNKAEFEAIVGNCNSLLDMEIKAQTLMNDLKISNILITLGENGLFLTRRNQESIKVEAQKVSVYNVTGAGDTAMASVVASFLKKNTWKASLEFSALCSEYVIGINHTSTITDELATKIP
jgi:D-beta-D-heptose 7-phosphate kinase/D-beta-D-heptose 1-phosphate adenosyltransferase